LTENGSSDSKIRIKIPKEWRPITVNDSVEPGGE
jgi:hypothetical protein